MGEIGQCRRPAIRRHHIRNGLYFLRDSSFINVKPDRWTKCEFIYTLDDTAVSDAKQAGMLTLSAEGNMSNIYIDDIVVQELVSDVQIVSKENTLGTDLPHVSYSTP